MKTPQDRSAKRATISDLSHGKALERDLATEMNKLEMKVPMLWERVVDSAYAGNIIRDADCDFKLTVPGAGIGQPFLFWIECKASINHTTFVTGFRGLVKTNQLALMRKGERAGACGFYMFRAEPSKKIEIWSLQDIAAWYYQKRVTMLSEPKFVFGDHRLAEFCEKLVTQPDHMLRKILT